MDFGPHKNAAEEYNIPAGNEIYDVKDTPEVRRRLIDAGYKIDEDDAIFDSDNNYVCNFYE